MRGYIITCVYGDANFTARRSVLLESALFQRRCNVPRKKANTRKHMNNMYVNMYVQKLIEAMGKKTEELRRVQDALNDGWRN